MTRFLLLLPLLFAGWCYADPPAETVTFHTPIYTAEIDCEKRMLRKLTCIVRREYLDDAQTDRPRDWWTTDKLSPYCLEDEDYTGSGYDRGHTAALQWFANSPDWRYVNCMAVIVPQLPEINRGAIKRIENHIADLAREYGMVWVEVTCEFDGPCELSTADESHCVPSGYVYEVIPLKNRGIPTRQTRVVSNGFGG